MNLLTSFPHLDLTALDSKATSRSSGNTKSAESAEARRAAQEFEAIMLSQLTSALRSESSEDGESLFGGEESGLAQNLFTEQLAISMANSGGIGLADLIARHLNADTDASSAEASHIDRAIETSRHLRGSVTLPTVTSPVSSNSVPPASAEMLSMTRPRRVGTQPAVEPTSGPEAVKVSSTPTVETIKQVFRESLSSPSAAEPDASIETLQQMTRPRRIAEAINMNVSSRAHGVRLPTRQEIGNIQMETAAIKKAFIETPASASKPVYTGRPKIDAIIQQASAHFGLDPYLLAAVLHTESSGRQNAVSSKGASGFMQMMPATFRQYAGPGKDIFDPKDNINGGAAYLKFLSNRYSGRLDKILAAYNAGEGNVDRFGGIPPFKETRNFVASVKKNYNDLRAAAEPAATRTVGTIVAASPANDKQITVLPAEQSTARIVINPQPKTEKVRVVLAKHESSDITSGSIDLQSPVEGRISSIFGARRPHGRHKGIDIAASRGTAIEASASGEVVFAGWKQGYGKTVIIKHQDGVHTRYAHAEDILVSRGDLVQPGQQVATVGSTGRATGPHLHFEVVKGGRRINPMGIFNNNPARRLAAKLER